KVRYVHALIAKTNERKREDERLFEKRLVTELKQELEENGDSEKFVTSAYKAQLMANKKWEDERNAKDNFVAKDDVRKKADLSGQFASDGAMPLLKPRFRLLQQHAPRQERGYWSQCARGVPSQGCW
ncbi:hypothetical protein GUITHDRAFT_82379, partial [Guillardia theta CCMP2712]